MKGMVIKVNFKQCNSANYKTGRTGKIEYIVIHYTANNGDTAKNNADYYAGSKVGASAHYFVDEREVWQSVKDSDTAWAVGGTNVYKHPKCRNANSISVELCSRNKNGSGRSATDSGWYFKDETVKNAAALTRELMKKYNIPRENVLRHFDVWAKICPAPFVNDAGQWRTFLKLLEDKMEKVYNYIPEMPDWAQKPMTKLYNLGFLKGDGEGLALTLGEIRIYCVLVRILEANSLI